MALKHDAQGFLVGDPIDLSKAVADWAAIRDDVRAIRQAVLGIESALNRAAPEARASVPATPGRGAGLEEADPTVKAFNEVAQPMARDAGQGADTSRAPQNPQAVPARQALTGQPAQAARRERQIPVLLRAPAVPQTGGAGGNAARRDTESAAAVTRAVAELRATRQAVTRAPAQPMGRDSRGRFVRGAAAARPAAGGGRGAGTGGPADGERDGQDESALRSLGDRIVGAFKESGAGLEEADPTVKAFNEVAQPMARGYELLTGGDSQKKQEGWLRRIYGSLTGFRKDEGLFNKVAAKRLKAIEEKPVAEAGGGGGLFGGLLGMLGGLLKRIPGVGALAAGAGGLLARGGGLLAGAGRMAAGAGSGLLGLGRGALRRIPIIGALLGGIGAATDIYDSEADDTLTRREKDQRAGKAVGGLAGTMGGMFAGAKLGAMVGAFAGPVGAAIGGAIGGAAGLFFGDQAGQIIGTTVGGWVSDLRDADIPGKIAAAWDTAVAFVKDGWQEVKGAALGVWESVKSGWADMTDSLKSAWDGALAKLEAGWQSVKDAGNQVAEWAGVQADSANDFIKDKTGIDIKAGATQAWSYVSDAATTAGDAVVGAGRVVVDKAIEIKDKAVELGAQAADAVGRGASWAAENTTVGRGSVKAWEGAKAAGNWVLGQTSKVFESGKGGAGTVSSGKGDFGGASYGTYQLSSAAGTLQKFLSSSKYGEQFAGLKPGTPEFDAKWKALANSDPSFGDAQHSFIQASHYDPAMSGLKDAGIDLSQRGAAVQDAIWSSSVQFGAGNAKRGTGAIGMFQKALAGRDVATMSDQDIVAAVQDYKIANNDKLFASSSAAVRAGTAKRAVAEKERLLALAGEQSAPVAAGAPAQPGSPEGSPSVQAVAQATPQNPASAQQPAPPRAAAAPEGVTAPAAPALAQVSAPAAPVGIVAPAAPVVAAVSVPTVPAAPVVPPIADAPPVAVPMAGADARKPVAVVAQPAEVGQDLRERGIAHIATGGLGGA